MLGTKTLKERSVDSYYPGVPVVEINEAVEAAPPEESAASTAVLGRASLLSVETQQQHYPPPLTMCCRQAGRLPVGHPSLVDEMVAKQHTFPGWGLVPFSS